MLFNTLEFTFIFFPIVVILGIFIKKCYKVNFFFLFLIVCSLYFYGSFYPLYLILISGSILLNFMSAKLLLKFENLFIKHAFFLFIIFCNLIILVYYKYFNFLIDNLNFFFKKEISQHHIILPLAISFFTFQQIAFITSIYKGEIKNFKFIKYFLFVSFFPQLIAGPIVKFKEFYPQLSKSKNILSNKNITLGLYIFSIGMVKKIIISSYLATIADPIFLSFESNIEVSKIDSWIGLIAFSLQIYFDFSGYSDMAIGLALCFGIKLPLNFFSPYKASSFKEFWNCWHITLSRFLKEHLYILLGGNKKGTGRTLINIFLTMLLGGIWHGASWNFLLWGAYHGLLIVLEKIVINLNCLCRIRLHSYLRRPIIFSLITLGWIPFRCNDFTSAKLMLKNLFFSDTAGTNFNTPVFFIILIILFVVSLFPNSFQIQSLLERKTFNRNNYLYLIIIYSIIFLLLYAPSQNINREFIYFQF